METRGERKRASYFSEVELKVLMRAYEEYKPIITIKSNTAASAKERVSAWQKITDRVNACNASVTRRTLSQVRMKYKNIVKQANKKKAEAHKTSGGPPPPSLTPAEELALPLNEGRPVIDGIPGGSSSDSAANTSGSVKYVDGQFVLLDPPGSPHSVVNDEDEETKPAVKGNDTARPIENTAGDVNGNEGQCTSTMNLGSLPARELYKIHLLKQIVKCDLEMDLIQLNAKKTSLEIEMLKHQLEGDVNDNAVESCAAAG